MGYDAIVDSTRLNGALTATAEAIRSKTDSTEPITFDMDEGFKTAVNGIELGGDTEAAYNEGVEAGKQDEYDAFWDTYQQNGTRTDYATAFGGNGWTNDTFKPKYNITPTNATYMFRTTALVGDLVKIFDNLGISLDFSNCTMANELFSNVPGITRVGIIDFRKTTAVSNAFSYSGINTIDKIIFSANSGVSYFPGAASKLESMIVEGIIAKNGFNAQYCTKLNKASIISVINALSTTTSGLSVTFSKVSVNKAFETSEGANDGSTSTEWIILIGTRSNWTISLI